ILAELDRYPAEAEIAWVQEEPANMGAWPTMALWLPGLLERVVRVIAPAASSAPALGSSVAHAADHQPVIERVLSRGQPRHFTDRGIEELSGRRGGAAKRSGLAGWPNG